MAKANIADFRAVTNGDFTLRPDGELGATDTMHGVFFGRLSGREVAVKAHADRAHAEHEARVLRLIACIGVTAVKPLKIIPFSRTDEAFLVTQRIPGLTSGASLPFAGDPRRVNSSIQSVTDFARTLGYINGRGISHGDSQLKNFGLIRDEVDSRTRRPVVVVYDTEKGGSDDFGHVKSSPYDHDLGSLAQSLAYKGFGGPRLDHAADLLVEHVLAPYEAEATRTGLDQASVGAAVNHGFDSFIEVRDKLSISSGHPH